MKPKNSQMITHYSSKTSIIKVIPIIHVYTHTHILVLYNKPWWTLELILHFPILGVITSNHFCDLPIYQWLLPSSTILRNKKILCVIVFFTEQILKIIYFFFVYTLGKRHIFSLTSSQKLYFKVYRTSQGSIHADTQKRWRSHSTLQSGGPVNQMKSLDDHPQSDKQNKCLSPSCFTTFKCTEKLNVYSPLQRSTFWKKVLQKLNNGLKSSVKQAKLPCWLHLLLLQLLLNLPFLQHQNLKYSNQQKNLFGCLLTAGTRHRMKNKPITFNKPHRNHLGFPTSKSWKNVSKEIYLSITHPSFMFLERVNSKGKGLGERISISSFLRPFFPTRHLFWALLISI